jgi:uncharacterized protein
MSAKNIGHRVALAAAALTMLVPSAALAQVMEPPVQREAPRLISVNGQAEIRLEPNIVTLGIGVEERGPDVAGPRNRAAEKMQAIIQRLRALGVQPEEIQTSRFTVNRVWEPDPVQPRPGERQPGRFVFVVSNVVTVRTTLLDRAGDLLDAAITAGANVVNGPFFALRDDREPRRQALEQALVNAREKADALARVAGVQIVGVQSITEGGVHFPPPGPPMGRAMMAMEAADMPTPIETGQIVITATVSAQYRLE